MTLTQALSFRASNDIAGNPELLLSRLEADGYLFMGQFLDLAQLRRVRNEVLDSLNLLCLPATSNAPEGRGGFAIYPGDTGYSSGLEALLRLPSLYALKATVGLESLFGVLGTHLRTVPRITLPGGRFHMSAGPDTVAVWIPLDDTQDLLAGDVLVCTGRTARPVRTNLSAQVRVAIDCAFQSIAQDLQPEEQGDAVGVTTRGGGDEGRVLQQVGVGHPVDEQVLGEDSGHRRLA